MKFNCYNSGDDIGANIILQATALQPDTVLGLYIISYPGDPNRLDPSAQCYDTLKEFSDECGDGLHKYQAAVILTHAPDNIFDVTATLFHPRYPEGYLMQLASNVPRIPCFWTRQMMEGIKTVSGFHECSRAKKRDWVTGPDDVDGHVRSLRTELEHLLSAGLRAKGSHPLD